MKHPIEITSWPTLPAAGWSCGENEAHILAASLEMPSGELEKFSATLSVPEIDRAVKFKFDRHRNRFVAGRGMLRAVLGRCLNVNPVDLDFIHSPHGKPALSAAFAGSGIHFNLAHSDNLAVIAVTRTGPIGVDVERIRALKDADDLVERFFSERESKAYQPLAAEQKPAAFFNLWTRKEALLKATGEGIGGGLNRVEVSFLPGEPARVLAIGGDAEEAARWSLNEFSPAAQFVGAVALKAPGVRISYWRLA